MGKNKYFDESMLWNDSYFAGQLRGVYRPYDFQDKGQNVARYCIQMLNRTSTMFEYENLPDTIPKRVLERYLQINGRTLFFKHNDEYYVSFGTYGGEPDEYYEPTLYIVANPYLKLFKTFNLKTDECVLIRNDSSMIGLTPTFRAYATQLAENDLSIRLADIVTRAMMLITAPDDGTKQAVDEFLKKMVQGDLSAILTDNILEGMKDIQTLPYANGSTLAVSMTSLIELQQYLKAGWNNDVGLNANYNMKRESLNSNESQLNEDALLPTPADMLEQRRIARDKINEMFGLELKVDLSSAWKRHEVLAENEVEMLNGDGETVDSVEDNLSSEPETSENTAEEPESVSEGETEETSADNNEDSPEASESSVDDIIEEKVEEVIEEIEEAIENMKEEPEDEENN